MLVQNEDRIMPSLATAAFRALGDFWRKGCSSLAASIAYFFLLSFVPSVSLILFLFGRVLSPGHATFEFLLAFLRSFFPDLDVGKAAIIEGIQKIVPQLGLHWVMFAAFVWAAIQVFGELDNAINLVFEAGKKRHPIVSTIISVLLLGVTFVVLFASYATTQAVDFLAANAPRVAEIHRAAAMVRNFLLSQLLPLILVVGAVSLLYRFLPALRPGWRGAIKGGLLFALLWELAKHLFAHYMVRVPQLGRMYGSLLTLVLGLMWVYYSAVLFLYCGAVVHRLESRRQK
jgi:membrane protein